MPLPPIQSNSLFNSSGQLLGGSAQQTESTFQVNSAGGIGSQESSVAPLQPAVTTRHLISWLVPEGPVIQMYINPQNIRTNSRKLITPQRTKGGFIIQYWGEELKTIVLTGHTGTSGIEGINVLQDIYRNEQLQFDPFALAIAAKYVQDQNSPPSATDGFAAGLSFVSSLLGASESNAPAAISNPPTLASLAVGIEMYWSGEVHRGYFTSFDVTESAERLGIFDYTINFTITQTRGFRQNFLGWHKNPSWGPSDSNPQFGRPHSFSRLTGATTGSNSQVVNNGNSSGIDPFDIF